MPRKNDDLPVRPEQMINRRFVSRRDFMKCGFYWSLGVGLSSFFPACFRQHSTMDHQEKRQKFAQRSLRELAEAKAHHQGNGRFLNPFSTEKQGNLWRVLYWKLFDKNDFKSFYAEEPIRPVKVDWGPIEQHHGCVITYLKHGCVMIKDGDTTILVDPVLGGLMWFEDFSPFAFRLDEMPEPDHVLITHGHFDHLDTHSLSLFEKHTHVITPLGYDNIFEDLEMTNRSQLDWFENYSEQDREIILLPCNHWTMRNPLKGPNDSLWGSFLIRTASGVTIYVSGDTAYFDRFRELGREYPIDLAIFNLGAYEPRWFMAGSHINPEETAKAFAELNARHLLVVHWGSFRLGDEPVHFPPRDIRREMEKRGIVDRLIHLDHGQSLFYDESKQIQVI
jgi:N-acyl-phosphatidylethanolamine-hydrolysing phospholipase D